MNNSVYGKTIESKRRQSRAEITRNAEKAEKLVLKFEFETFKTFGENMAAMCSKPKLIKWNTPTILGATVLDLSKYNIYRFHYQVMRQTFNVVYCTRIQTASYTELNQTICIRT